MDINEILNSKGIEWKQTNNPSEILIKCTSGEHDDSNPSLSYNLERNVFKCFSCGFAGGQNKFLQSIGITTKIQIESKQEYKVLKLKRKLQRLINNDTIKMPRAITNVTWDFHDINKKTLIDFNAFLTSEYELEDYVCIPVFQFQRLRFIDGRYKSLDKKENIPKYLRKPSNVSVASTLFPLDKIDKTNHVILVEGMYDMLNLWQHGIRNVLCIFGANNFGQEKIDILEKLNITKVTLMMDGDTAGRSATVKIQSILEKNDILTNRIYLKEGEDPGKLSLDKIMYYLPRAEND